MKVPLKAWLSGPMTLLGWPAFDLMEKALLDKGWEVRSPANIYRDENIDPHVGLDRGTINVLQRKGMAAMTDCDAIVLLPGWGDSQEALAEFKVAKHLDMLIYEGEPDLGVVRIYMTPPDVIPCKSQSAVIQFLDPAFKQFEDLDQGERPVTGSTGGMKNAKLAAFDLVPPGPLYALAEHYGKGRDKYPDSEPGVRNWERGTNWSLNFAALQRHAWQFWHGEDIDPGTGSHHMTAVAWHAFALYEFGRTHPELDDRSKSSVSALTNNKEHHL